jgi:PPK2 family polyphosphate:nucleotide phosphotransferase
MKLKEFDTRAPEGVDKETIKNELSNILVDLNELQNLMYAEGKHSLLVVIQGMDASGKDGVIRDVFSSMNPQGLNVTSFKSPTKEELAHDFLWRIHQHTPPKGMIHIFNRSHYEDILITRVHDMIDDKTAKKRMQDINNFEKLLIENDTHVLKFYLNVSHEKQLIRLQERLSVPEKMWKYNQDDFTESKLWDEYMKAYNDAITECNNVPWYIIPSDQNWYKSFLVAKTIKKTLEGLKMKFPGLKKEKQILNCQ